MTLIALLLARLIVMAAKPRFGLVNNAKTAGIEPRLPAWLSWFDTPDNSLYGDEGWRTKHCPDAWRTPAGMAAWLRRNPALGFCWKTLGHQVTEQTIFTVSGTLGVDKGQDCYGWYWIRTSDGAFQFRFSYAVIGFEIAGDFGWLLEPYVNRQYARPLWKALYQFSAKVPSILALIFCFLAALFLFTF
jgi:hypothetical protein